MGAAAFVLAGSAALAVPGTASAETKTVPCGSTVSAKPGDHIVGKTLLGLSLDLGIVTQGVGQLLSGLCKVTVTVVNAVVTPIPVVGAPVAGALTTTTSTGTNTLTSATNQLGSTLTGNQTQPPAPQKPVPGAPGKPPSPPASGGPSPTPQGNTPAGGAGIPKSNSQVLAGYPAAAGVGSLPVAFSTGYAPTRDYSTIPIVASSLYSPAPGLRYGSQIPGYAPEFGILGQDGNKPSITGIQNAGQAEALPGPGGARDGVGLPVLFAVLLLSGVSAGLVRTWVLRRTATSV